MILAAISDKHSGELCIFDVHGMSLLHRIPVGAGAYPVDQVEADLIYVSTRDETSVRPVRISTAEALDAITLGHHPRSTTWDRQRGRAFVGGKKRVWVSVIDTNTGTVIAKVGSGAEDPRRDFGGGLACGHPGVGPDGEVILLDRIARRIELYAVDKAEPLDSVNLPSSPHHVHQHSGRYFVLCEGNRGSRIAPSVVELHISGGQMKIVAHTMLPVLEGDWGQTGGHHLTIDDELERLYVGTASAWLYTLTLDGLRVLSRTETGPGCGHVTRCPDVGLSVTTNHTGTAMTVIDLKTNRRIRDITVSSPVQPGKKTQGHTSFWSAETQRLYTTAAQDGAFLEIDPVAGLVTRRVDVAGADLIQGCILHVPDPTPTA